MHNIHTRSRRQRQAVVALLITLYIQVYLYLFGRLLMNNAPRDLDAEHGACGLPPHNRRVLGHTCVSICTQFSQSTLISWIRRTIDNVVDRRKTALLQELKSLVESTDTDERAAKAATKECMDELHLNWFDRVRL